MGLPDHLWLSQRRCGRWSGRISQIRAREGHMDQSDRFGRWRKKIPASTAKLVDLVSDQIVPLFQARGIVQHTDYAGGRTLSVGANCIPLQLRQGVEWPTVEILFDKRARPALGVTFAMLPELCFRKTERGPIQIPRSEANVTEGPAFFSLCKGHRGYNDRNFGYYYFSLSPNRKLIVEINTLKSLLPWLFDLFESGIPDDWLQGPPRYVDRHAFLVLGSRNYGDSA